MSEMLNRVAAFGGDNGACGAADPKETPASACGSACGSVVCVECDFLLGSQHVFVFQFLVCSEPCKSCQNMNGMSTFRVTFGRIYMER